jgi:hypothetical protein
LCRPPLRYAPSTPLPLRSEGKGTLLLHLPLLLAWARPFSGRGSLIKLANAELRPVWERGDAPQIQAAMNTFVTKYWKDFLAHAPCAPTEKVEYRAWLKQFAHWIYSTDHIRVRYEIEYDRVDIRKLSPGTRGIVLLLLYLALDEADDRPLILNQPEENLESQDELVGSFVEANEKTLGHHRDSQRKPRVNTDADQIIIADAGPHPAGGLPPITYIAGGLEDGTIRKAVCDILEGGAVRFENGRGVFGFGSNASCDSASLIGYRRDLLGGSLLKSPQ